MSLDPSLAELASQMRESRETTAVMEFNPESPQVIGAQTEHFHEEVETVYGGRIDV